MIFYHFTGKGTSANGDLCREYTDDGGSAHAALPADTLTRTFVIYRESREEPLIAVPG